MPRIPMLVTAMLFSGFILSGCVAKDTYVRKQAEAERFEKSLKESRAEYARLSAENEQLRKEIAGLSGQLKTEANEREALLASKKGLEQSLRSTADAKNQKIGQLSQELSDLAAENRRLKEDLARLKQLKEQEVQKTSKTYEDLLEKMKGEISKGQVTISELKGKLTVNLVESVLFDSGKAEVKPEGLVVLQKVVDVLKQLKDKSIRIEGHTDNVPIVGSLARRYPSNWELSAARAINVTKYLQQQGIDAALLAAVAYGEYHPVAPNDTDEGKAKNRRIEIILASKE